MVSDCFLQERPQLSLGLCIRQRKLRRDMLASPIVPERGRSRSREAYPQMVRSNSRGRSLSMERRGSRKSSDGSLADMEEMSKTLFRWWDGTYEQSLCLPAKFNICLSVFIEEKCRFAMDPVG